jgi:pyruvate/2-oxoglutarate dehydrogenase complex dihydrolipoamide dehydrogenase (E3) component
VPRLRGTSRARDHSYVEKHDVLVVGAGPAGVVAAFRAAQLGARTTLVTKANFGGMAANDGPIPVRTLAQAARLIRESHHLGRYGIDSSRLPLDYTRLLDRVREVVEDVRARSALRHDLEAAGVAIHENVGAAHFVDPHTIEVENGLCLQADRIILCVGGANRRLPVPGFELTASHSDAWTLTSVPATMLVVGAGATGAQVASIFSAFGSDIQLFEAGTRILSTEDQDVSATVAAAFAESGISVHEDFGAVERFEKTADGVRMVYSKRGHEQDAEAAVAVVAIGWTADTIGLRLASAGVDTDPQSHVHVDAFLRTSANHIYAAGDVTTRCGLASVAIQDGHVAATNAVYGPVLSTRDEVIPVGSFTDPEYAHVGLTEENAHVAHDIVVSTEPYDSVPRPIIDGRTTGFCKLVIDRPTRTMLGCHIVGERAVEIAQVAATAMTARMSVDDFARIPMSFPTYTDVISRAAFGALRKLDPAKSLERSRSPRG